MRLKPYARLIQKIGEVHLRRLAAPFKLTFAVTFHCNYRCRTCGIWQRHSRDELTTEEIEKFFRRNPQFLWVDLTGGEPWLRKDFVTICKTILNACPDLLLLHFPTNGYLTETIVAGVREIVACRPERLIITVSMDGDEAMNDAIRGVPGGWRRQMETFKQLRAIRGVRVVLGMTLSRDNVGHFPKAFESARAECPGLDVKDFHVNIVHASAHYFGNVDVPQRSPEETQRLIDAVNDYRRRRGLPLDPVSFLEHEYLRRVERYLRSGMTPTRCHALRSSCFVDAWGQVFPCTIYDRRIGRLREQDFDLAGLWNRPETQQIQKEIWAFQCPQCWTPCEAYQSLLGNFFRPGSSPRAAPRTIQ
jgi:radical SAM protein with 4Fe4S-binding SPASM domain